MYRPKTVYTAIFRLYSECESNDDHPLYDILDLRQTQAVLHKRCSLKNLEYEFLCTLQDKTSTIVLVVPAQHTRQVKLPLVRGSAKNAIQSAPFLVEETLATNLQSCHVAVTRDASTGQISALVIEHEKLLAYLDDFLTSKISVEHIFRDCDTLAETEFPSVYLRDTSAIIKTKHLCHTLTLDYLADFLEAGRSQLQSSGNEPLHLKIETPEGTPGRELFKSFDDIVISNVSDHWFPERFDISDTCTDLAQGRYATRKFVLGMSAAQISVLISGYAGIVLLLLTYQGLSLYYESKSEALINQQIALYQMLFPQDEKIVNLRVQFEQQLARITHNPTPDRFNTLMSASIIEFQDIAAQSNASIRALLYQSSPPALALSLWVDGVGELNDYQQRLALLNLNAHIKSINQLEDRFSGQVVVSAECALC